MCVSRIISDTCSRNPKIEGLPRSFRLRHTAGAGSIRWFHQWAGTGDPSVRQRILEYNEDDCRAMRVLVDAIGRPTGRQTGGSFTIQMP